MPYYMDTEIRYMSRHVASVAALLTFSVLASAGDGLPPRAAPSDYPAHRTVGNVTVAAAYVPPAEAKKLFAEDLAKHDWLVFEIALYPSEGATIDASADDFRLRQGSDPSTVRSGSPHTVAADIRGESSKKPVIPGKVTVYNTETIGYETGGRGNPRGVYTGSGVGVGIGGDPRAQNPAPAPASGKTREELEQVLEEKAFPEGKTTKAVAGYAFFPKPSKSKTAPFELIYLGHDGQATLKLPIQ